MSAAPTTRLKLAHGSLSLCSRSRCQVSFLYSSLVYWSLIAALLFTTAGFIQMKIWANGKHRNYKKEFEKYPKGRTPIIPFVC